MNALTTTRRSVLSVIRFTAVKIWNNKLPVSARIIGRMISRTSQLCNDDVLVEVYNHAGLITLNRPKVLNTYNLPMIRKIHPAVKAWEKDGDIGLIIMKGAGDKAFCAGGDVKTFVYGRYNSDLASIVPYEVYKLDFHLWINISVSFNLTISVLAQLSTPLVALINGITMGGGVGLSIYARYRVASEKTIFAMPENAIGLFPDVGAGYFLPRLQGKLGLFLGLTGHRLKAGDVYFTSIATHFVSSKQVPYLEEELLNMHHPTDEKVKSLLDFYHQKDEGIRTEFSLKNQMDTINRIFCSPTMESIYENLEKDGSEWAIKQLETLKKMNPISLKITMRQLEKGSKMSLADTLIMEYRMIQVAMYDDNFYEGIRALLIDKDGSPKWNPSNIEDVTKEIVDSYFQKLSEDRELKF